MRALFFVCSLIFATLNASAQQMEASILGGPSKKPVTEKVSPHGYRYVHHRQLGGPKPKVGETCLFFVNVWAGDVLLQRSKGAGFRLEVVDQSLMGHVPPMMDISTLIGKGDSMTVYQKVDEAMREALPKEAKTAENLRFELVLNDIISSAAMARYEEQLKTATMEVENRARATAEMYRNGALNDRLKHLPSGLKYMIETPGQGAAIKQGEMVQVHYFGVLRNGAPFDESYQNKRPTAFPAGGGQMIFGFDEGVMQLKHGDKAYLFIPPDLAYGEQSSDKIPANSELIFYIEVF